MYHTRWLWSRISRNTSKISFTKNTNHIVATKEWPWKLTVQIWWLTALDEYMLIRYPIKMKEFWAVSLEKHHLFFLILSFLDFFRNINFQVELMDLFSNEKSEVSRLTFFELFFIILNFFHMCNDFIFHIIRQNIKIIIFISF